MASSTTTAASSEAANNIKTGEHSAPVYKFVLTGGPCGGKSTSLTRLSSYLRERGFRVFLVPEAATLLFSNGASFADLPDEHAQGQFQVHLMQTQMHLEDTFAGLAGLTRKPSVLLCDRGLMDGAAYVSADQFARVLETNGLDVVTARDQRYNAVFHLVTAAEGAEKFYQRDNNLVRSETVEEARDLDGRLLKAWVGHHHLYVFDNKVGFEEKLQKIVARISQIVGLPATVKHCRRYRMTRMPAREDINVHFEEFDVEKVYLIMSRNESNPSDGYTFVRKRGQQAVASFAQTTVYLADGKKTEQKRILTAREYSIAVKQRTDPSRYVVRQRRISFMWNQTYYEIVEYLTPEPGLCLLHVQDDGSQVTGPPTVPDWISLGEECTHSALTSAYYLSLKDKATYPFPLNEASADD